MMKKNYCLSKRQSVCRKALSFSGGIHPTVLFSLFAMFLSGVIYLHSLNRGATQGYEMRALEKEMAVLKEENKKLKLAEAEALSLSRIEESVVVQGMDHAESARVIEGRGSFALR